MAVNAQERARTIPRLPRAKTVACGLVKWGRGAWMIVVHSVTRGGQDIGILLGGMGETQLPIRCFTEGGLVTSLRMSYRHFSKTYCRKVPGPGLQGGKATPGSMWNWTKDGRYREITDRHTPTPADGGASRPRSGPGVHDPGLPDCSRLAAGGISPTEYVECRRDRWGDGTSVCRTP